MKDKDFHYTPLHEAVFNTNIEVVKFLVSEGAEVNAKTWHGKTPLDLAVNWNKNGDVAIYLSSLAERGDNTELVECQTSVAEQADIDEFIAKYGNDIKTVDENGWTLLHVATHNWNTVELIKFLVFTGADVTELYINFGPQDANMGKLGDCSHAGISSVSV